MSSPYNDDAGGCFVIVLCGFIILLVSLLLQPKQNPSAIERLDQIEQRLDKIQTGLDKLEKSK